MRKNFLNMSQAKTMASMLTKLYRNITQHAPFLGVLIGLMGLIVAVTMPFITGQQKPKDQASKTTRRVMIYVYETETTNDNAPKP